MSFLECADSNISLVRQTSQRSTNLQILSHAEITKNILWNLSNVLFTPLCPVVSSHKLKPFFSFTSSIHMPEFSQSCELCL